MEHNKSAARKHQSADSSTVLFAGLPGQEADTIVAAFRQRGWTVMALSDQDEIKIVFAAQRFDVTVIDAEHIDVFAPHFITRLRSTKGRSAQAAILAVDNSVVAGFKDQLLKSGTDIVTPKPADPKPHLVNFTLAATCRLQNSAPTLA